MERRLLEGYVPEEDATIVSRVLDAGATRDGKGGLLRSLCFSGGSHTKRHNRAGCGTPTILKPFERRLIQLAARPCFASQAVDLALGGDQGGSIRASKLVGPAFTGLKADLRAWFLIRGHFPSR